jgi:hypothetical protein
VYQGSALVSNIRLDFLGLEVQYFTQATIIGAYL